MKHYDGSQPDDRKPIKGGAWNEDHCGGEVYNFRKIRGRFYAFCQPGRSKKINLNRIDPDCQDNLLSGVLVIFVAVDPNRGKQRVVGWYGNATVFRLRQKPRSRRRGNVQHFAVAAARDSALLRIEPYERNWLVKAGPGGIGQANVCYLYGPDGLPKNLKWQKRVLGRIENHRSRK
jgi:hypothetical protein